MTSRPPTVRRRRLGAELRRLREQLGYTADEVATLLGWSPSKLSRIENARIGINESDVLLLLETYRVNERRAQDLIALGRAAAQPGWWEEFHSDISPNLAAFVALEDEADSALCYETHLVPGLLQTQEYAEQVLRSLGAIAEISNRRIARRLELRMRRQCILTRSNPLQLSLVLDESALMRNIGGPEVMRVQLERLVEWSDLPNVSLQVLPLCSKREPIMGESFVLLQFAAAYETDFPDIAHVDTIRAMEIQADEMTARYRAAWERLAAGALPADGSRRVLSEHLERLG